jgi:CDP-glycerol glycerophosphotransferase (TagB/SpsB family)
MICKQNFEGVSPMVSDPERTEGELVQLARDAAARQDRKEVLALCETLRAQYPKSAPGYGLAAVALRKLGQAEASNAMVWASVKAIGLRAGHLITMADTAMDLKNWEEALCRWSDVRAAFPEQPQGYYRAAVAHRALKQYEACDALLEEKMTRVKPEVRDFNLWADSAIDRGAWELAADRLEKMQQTFPKEPGGYVTGARVMSELQHEENAVHSNKYAGESHSLKQEFDALYRGMRKGRFDLQNLIDAAGWIVRSRAVSQQTRGAQRLFRLAETDANLAKVLAGETIAPPAYSGGRAIRPLFFFPTVTQTDNLTPLLETMAQDPRFEPIVLCSRNRSKANDDSYAFFSKLYAKNPRITVVDGGMHIDENISPYELGADVVFFHTPYSHGPNHPFFLWAEFVARHTRIAHVNYGYFLLTLEGTASHIYDSPHIQTADMVFSEGDVSDRVFRDCFGDARVYKTGYPKFDSFRAHLEKTPFEERVADKEKLDIIWTPHWQMAEDPTGGTHTSNFTRYVDTMLQLSARDDVVLHVRPHPLLRPRLKVLGLYDFHEYDAIMDRFKDNGAVVYPANEGVSYVEALMSADVLISDFSSLVPEFFITERPIIFCRTDDVWNNGKWIGPFGKTLIEKGCYTVDDEEELVATLSEIVAKRQHPKMENMQQLIEENNLFPEGSSCARIVEVVAERVTQS